MIAAIAHESSVGVGAVGEPVLGGITEQNDYFAYRGIVWTGLTMTEQPGVDGASGGGPAATNGNTQQQQQPPSDDLPGATPRDVRLLHLILASMGVTAYQDRVPLQLMDFAYRYTHSVLQDALYYNDHAGASGNTLPAGVGPSASQLTVDDVRLAVGARVNYQFKPAPPKELLLEMAQEKNKRPLPTIPQQYGIRLPPEKYCLTSKEWKLDDEKDETISEYVEQPAQSVDPSTNDQDGDAIMGGQS